MGLIGIVLACLVNIFIGSSALQFAISVIGVIVFTGLTAYDTQRIKQVFLATAWKSLPPNYPKLSSKNYVRGSGPFVRAVPVRQASSPCGGGGDRHG